VLNPDPNPDLELDPEKSNPEYIPVSVPPKATVLMTLEV